MDPSVTGTPTNHSVTNSRPQPDQPTADPSVVTADVGPGSTADLLDLLDWSGTPLGARQDWPAELESAIRTVLASRLPVMLYWGEEFIQIYNDAFLPILGNKHPRRLRPTCGALLAGGVGDARPGPE